ncbi:MAG: MBOAT family O-acyltransferase [SAR324 cluster bacterium]|nr:MBOAT family O-acyltransferase [SAR324 cluster bacterium]
MIFIASLAFYGFWRVEFLPVMLASVLIDYFAAQKIFLVKEQAKKKIWLYLSLTINLGLLFYFKYLIFVAENIISLGSLLGIEAGPILLNIVLPLGISFYTFQTISYTIDVYRGVIEPEKDFLTYASFVTFFPQLVAGPVLRAIEVIPQLTNRPKFQWSNIAFGLQRIIFGLFLKVVLADSLGPIVDDAFSQNISSYGAIDILTIAFLFGFQIYFDFSAYSHIAIGTARMMGIYFPENFNFPYLACSPKDFWKRWHISLSSWIRDYVYLPLTGTKFHDRSIGGLASGTTDNKVKALLLTWAIMGLWHGAAWTFLVWGLYHAFAILTYRVVLKFGRSLPQAIQYYGGILVTLPFMMLGWIPFRAESLETCFLMYSKFFSPASYFSLGLRENIYLVAAFLLLSTFFARLVQKIFVPWLNKNKILSIITESFFFAVVITFCVIYLRSSNQFIYFQF